MFGGTVELNLPQLYLLRQCIIGIRNADESSKALFWRLAEDQHLRPIVDSVFSLDEVAEAHRRLESMANVGRVVLTVD
jgi:NADPH:quinone reductase-like Zn-dependent oxidoreductase